MFMGLSCLELRFPGLGLGAWGFAITREWHEASAARRPSCGASEKDACRYRPTTERQALRLFVEAKEWRRKWKLLFL